MDRLTGKTGDAYVEFVSLDEAVKTVGKHVRHRSGLGHAGRLGDRHVNVEVVGPEVLMHELFPKTKGLVLARL